MLCNAEHHQCDDNTADYLGDRSNKNQRRAANNHQGPLIQWARAPERLTWLVIFTATSQTSRCTFQRWDWILNQQWVFHIIHSKLERGSDTGIYCSTDIINCDAILPNNLLPSYVFLPKPFLAWTPPQDPTGGAYDTPPDPWIGWGWGPSPFSPSTPLVSREGAPSVWSAQAPKGC